MNSDPASELVLSPKEKINKLMAVISLGVLFLLLTILGGSFVFINVQNSGREPIKIEKTFSAQDFELIRAQSVSTRVVVMQGPQAGVTVLLEGHFRKSFGDPLIVDRADRRLLLKIDEAQEGSHRSELTVILPNGFSKQLEVETVSGRIDIRVSNEVAKKISVSTVSGEKTLTTN